MWRRALPLLTVPWAYDGGEKEHGVFDRLTAQMHYSLAYRGNISYFFRSLQRLLIYWNLEVVTQSQFLFCLFPPCPFRSLRGQSCDDDSYICMYFWM